MSYTPIDTIKNLLNTSLYVGLSDSITLPVLGGEESLLPVNGQGSLTVPANGFKVGDSFHLVMAGEILVGDKDDDFTFKVYQDGVVLGEITVKLGCSWAETGRAGNIAT